MKTDDRVRGVTVALLAAALFGASTPINKLLLGRIDPLLIAGSCILGRVWVWLGGLVYEASWQKVKIARPSCSGEIYRCSAPRLWRVVSLRLFC
jgi:drug/metabolite transporter (DMT)-like permease